jgi:hypothetical protein
MEEEWKKNSLFDLKHASLLPLIQISDVEITSLEDNVVRLKVTVENEGFLPTNVTQKAIDNSVAKPVRLKLELTNAELMRGKPEIDIGHIKGLSPLGVDTTGRRATPVENKKTVAFVIRAQGGNAAAKITAISEKAGTKTKEVQLAAK